jgi:2-phospho-L-lactate/phosphoenolpyruvate guanylyltransferase
MPTIVVPFRGEGAKLRLAPIEPPVRRELALAMLADVLAACRATGPTTIVTDDGDAVERASALGASSIRDPGHGQGAAVAAALATVDAGPALVVNADVPCAVPRDLRALLAAAPSDGFALVQAADGTTNALALPRPELFRPLYGPGSAERFRRHAQSLRVDAVPVAIPNLTDDVDTLADLRRLQLRVGPRTHAALARLGPRLAA